MPHKRDVLATWDELEPCLGSGWVRCTAWAVGSGDPDGVEIRTVGGRVQYESAWVMPGLTRVRLARLEPGATGIREVVRYLKPDDHVEVRRV